MTPSEAKGLIDAWLRAKLDEDAELREAPEGDTYAAAVFRKTEPWEPDALVEAWDEDQLATLLAQHGGDGRKLVAPGEYAVRGVTERYIATEAFRKPHVAADARRHLRDETVARPLVKALLCRVGIADPEGTPGFDAAVRMMMKAQANLYDAVISRDAVSWRPWSHDDPAQPLVESLSGVPIVPTTTPTPAGRAVGLMSEAEKSFLEEEERNGQSEGRLGEFKVAFRLFRDWLRRDPDLSEITPQIAGEFRIALGWMPSSASTRPEYRELSVAERLARAKEVGEKRLLSSTTIGGNYINPLKSLFEWARATGKITENPFANIRPPRESKAVTRKERDVFTTEQLKTLFAQPVFTGAAALGGKPMYRSGSMLVDDYRFWLPFMAMFSGARLNEMCGLELADFEQEGGVDFFHVRPDGGHKRVKTEAGVRRVPVHPELVKLGLLRRVARLREEGASRLFPEIRPGARGYLSDIPTKFFADLIDRALGKDAPVVFHSFRHTFITRLRAARVEPLLRMAIVGHDPGETHEEYGDPDIAALSAELSKVAYPGLDLSELPSRG
jgi:integrase